MHKGLKKSPLGIKIEQDLQHLHHSSLAIIQQWKHPSVWPAKAAKSELKKPHDATSIP